MKFPSKLIFSSEGSVYKHPILVVSDSGNERVLIINESTLECVDVIGTGTRGDADGDFKTACLNHPQGLVLWQNSLIICDVKNHKLRIANLETREVTTLAGTGRCTSVGSLPNDDRGILETDLTSPWDIIYWKDSKFLVAMSGIHQIWVLDLEANTIKILSGTGIEGNLNANAHDTTWAQPSGISISGNQLYVADSESSTIRSMNLDTLESENIVGGDDNPKNLFSFGDKDGECFEAKLQHPLAVHYSKGKVLITDSYNHKLKWVDPETKSVTTLLGGKGLSDSEALLNEPSGIASNGNIFYIADSNNDCVRKLSNGVLETPLFTKVPTLVKVETKAEFLDCEGGSCAYVPKSKRKKQKN